MFIKEKITEQFVSSYKEGLCLDAYNVFGAHLVKDKDGNFIGCEFALYAPNAVSVDLIGEWNNFTQGANRLEHILGGVWYCYLEGQFEWQRYKYLIITKQGEHLYKADPYAFYSQVRPSQDSKVYDIEGYKWNDNDW